MNKYKLPKYAEINGKEVEINTDYRDILKVFQALTDVDLLEQERLDCALYLFYKDDSYTSDVLTAINEMFSFITMCDDSGKSQHEEKPLYDWDQDFNVIVPAVNKILNTDIRGLPYLHWWTFLSAFMEIGESTFTTYISIRDKLNRGKKLEKWEEKIVRDNRDKVILKKKYDSATQSIMDDIMGFT
jgi:hypothetical protein